MKKLLTLLAALAVTLLLAGALIPLAVYWAGTVWFDRRTALWGCGFTVLNLTMIAQAPMLLSDTLFGLVAALMFGCFGKFHRKSRWSLYQKIKDPLKDQCGLKDMCLVIQWDV